MGDQNVRSIQNRSDRYVMYQHALKDIKAFDKMWNDEMFEHGPIHVGAEQELCVVDQNLNPSKAGQQILDKLQEEHFTHELALYNLEINLDPELLKKDCFSIMENKLLSFLSKGRNIANDLEQEILMTGILPTIEPEHLDFEYMTPIPRFETLSKMLYEIRGGEFEIYLQGIDDYMASLGSVLFEACNTSFQLHLQIKQSDFVNSYNWSQMIAGPVLAASVNSPLLFGNELWSESRIAIFKQSLDTRNSKNHSRKKIPRVYFGHEWLKDSPVNLWKNELIRFPIILTSDSLKDSMTELSSGKIPNLRAIRLHNGSTYTWNRLCYGTGDQPHLRIECRYLPAGPSAIDEISNFVFWAGLMNAVPENFEQSIHNIPFKDVKYNFMQAARSGLNCMLYWFGKYISARELILDELLPKARKGLEQCKISEADIDKYLGVIEKRVTNGQTGSEWMIRNYRNLKKKHKSKPANRELVSQMIDYQKENKPVHEWRIEKESNFHPIGKAAKFTLRVGDFMSTDIYSANEDTSIDLITNIFDWKNIHHLPIENYRGELVGIITDGILKSHKTFEELQYASDIMLRDVKTVDKNMKILDLITAFKKLKIEGLPVTFNDRLIGMITQNDIKDLI